MTKRDLLVLALKIFGVWLTLTFIMTMPFPLRFFQQRSSMIAFMSFFPWLAMGVIGYALIRHSEWVADKVCRADPTTQELSLGMTKSDIKEIAFVVIGISAVALCLPQVGSLLLYVFYYLNYAPGSSVTISPWQRLDEYSRLVRIVIQLALGLYFILGASGLVNLVKKARVALV